MKGIELLIRGLLAGLIISAPVGPVNVLCVSRTLLKGRRSGVVSGLGAAVADTVYGSVAAFSISFIIGFLLREQFWIRFFGGILLAAIGVRYYFRRPQPLPEPKEGSGEGSDFGTAFLLNLANPTTVLSFLAVLASLGLSRQRPPWATFLLVFCIFAGSMLWWLTLTALVNHFRRRFHHGAMVWMNRIAGLAIGGFGVVTLLLSRSVKGH